MRILGHLKKYGPVRIFWFLKSLCELSRGAMPYLLRRRHRRHHPYSRIQDPKAGFLICLAAEVGTVIMTCSLYVMLT